MGGNGEGRRPGSWGDAKQKKKKSSKNHGGDNGSGVMKKRGELRKEAGEPKSQKRVHGSWQAKGEKLQKGGHEQQKYLGGKSGKGGVARDGRVSQRKKIRKAREV